MASSEIASVDGLQQAVDTLAGRLGRSVAVDDTRGRLVVASRHFGDEDPLRTYAVMQRDSDPRVMAHFGAVDIYRWTRPGRIPADPDLGFKARVCCPIRAHDIPFGHLFLIDDGVEQHEIDLAAAVADDLGVLLHRRLVLHRRERARHDELVRDLIGDDPVARGEARRELLADVDAPVVALSVRLPDDGSPDTALRVALDHLTRSRRGAGALTTTTGRTGTALVLGDAATPEAARSLAGVLLADLRDAADGAAPRTVVGIGGPASGPDGAHGSATEAGLAARAATLVPTLGDVVAHADLGAYAVLLALPPRSLGPELLPAALRRLLAHDTGDLADTLETYLDECGDATRTAATLRVHRSTLYYRLGRIETVAGIDLHDGGHRLALHLGLKTRRLLGTPDQRTES